MRLRAPPRASRKNTCVSGGRARSQGGRPEELSIRPITGADLARLATQVADAFARYSAFAPADWRPNDAPAEVRVLEAWLETPGFWGEAAFDGPSLVGHAIFVPAELHSFRPERDPLLAHLGNLFVDPGYWGSGTAVVLLEHAMSCASARGYAAMRLLVAEGQTRARRFYEREGFTAVGEPLETGFGLPGFEYRRVLAG